jgi:hypothetical protein
MPEIATTHPDRELIQGQIERILANSLFSSTHRLSDFLRYVTQATLDGRTEIDQKEIAHAVLGRDDSFDPGEDAYVRKIATTVRQRLKQYYAGAGNADPVVILIPQGSYLPRFEKVSPDQPPPAARRPPRHLLPAVLVTLAVVAIASLVYMATRRAAASGTPSRFTIRARRGSILLQRNDALPGSILLGPTVASTDQVIARMVFTPRAELDQAGIMIFDDADNYVVLSRELQQLNYLHFAHEHRAGFSRAPESFFEDARAQTGEPVWLSIRRNGQEFRAFSSTDGDTWTPVGPVVHATLKPGQSRLALFAFSELEKDLTPTAVFDRVSAGPALATWGAPAPPLESLDGWQTVNECPAENAVSALPAALELTFADAFKRCRVNLLRSAPAGDWSLTANVENATWARTFAGLMASGPTGRVYVVRNSADHGSISCTTLTRTLVRRPDLPGNPPLTLRLYVERSSLHAAAGASPATLEALPVDIPLSELGQPLMIGVATGRGVKRNDAGVSPVRVHSVAFDVGSLTPWRTPGP